MFFPDKLQHPRDTAEDKRIGEWIDGSDLRAAELLKDTENVPSLLFDVSARMMCRLHNIDL